MSDLAKKARAAMKAKAERLGASRPTEKVSSADWTPPELLNADVKTGLRPISRRQFKKGGKVMGEACDARADRKPRKNGGKAEAAEWAKAKINRDVKAANQEREGKKHIGGMKAGGRAGKNEGGMASGTGILTKNGKDVKTPAMMPATEEKKAPPMPQRPQREPEKGMSGAEAEEFMKGRKSGGRAKKADGGDMYGPGVAGAMKMMKSANRAGVPGSRMEFQSAKSRISPLGGMKKGGAAEKHEDEAADKALIKKMVKPEARKGRATGGNVFSGSSYPGKIPGATGGRTAKAAGGKTRSKGKGKTNINIVIAAGKAASPQDMMGGAPGMGPTDNRGAGGIPVPVSMPPGGPGGMPGGGMPMPMPMQMPPAGGPPAPAGGMPMGRKAGGRVGKFGGGAMGKPNMLGNMGGAPMNQAMGGKPMGGMGKPMGGMGGMGKPNMLGGMGGPTLTGADMTFPNATSITPVNFPPMGGDGRGMGPSAFADMGRPAMMAQPMGQPMGQQMPQMAPMARKTGGRVSKTASSYKDMQAGAGSGEGRLQKTDIAKRGERKAGGKVYRSYKDMDAGAGSGEGRLEKTAIQSRKK